MKPAAMKKAVRISQAVLLANPLSASASVNVRVSSATASARNVTAPIGTGLATRPTMVATNTASGCHARGSTFAGRGSSQITMPTAATRARRPRSTLERASAAATLRGATSAVRTSSTAVVIRISGRNRKRPGAPRDRTSILFRRSAPDPGDVFLPHAVNLEATRGGNHLVQDLIEIELSCLRKADRIDACDDECPEIWTGQTALLQPRDHVRHPVVQLQQLRRATPALAYSLRARVA